MNINQMQIEDFQSAKDVLKNKIKDLEEFIWIAKSDVAYFSMRLKEEPDDKDLEDCFMHSRESVKIFSKELTALRIAQKLVKKHISDTITTEKVKREIEYWLNNYDSEIHDSSGWCDESDT